MQATPKRHHAKNSWTAWQAERDITRDTFSGKRQDVCTKNYRPMGYRDHLHRYKPIPQQDMGAKNKSTPSSRAVAVVRTKEEHQIDLEVREKLRYQKPPSFG